MNTCTKRRFSRKSAKVQLHYKGVLMANNNTVYVFWLRTVIGTILYSGIVKCLVSSKDIRIEFEQPLIIPLESIEACKVEIGGGATGRLSYVTLTLVNQKYPVRITTLNPLNSKLSIEQSNSDDIAFESIVNALKSNRNIALDPNPYNRELIWRRTSRYGHLEFDAHTPPTYYDEVFHPKLSKKEMTVRFLLTMLFMLTFFVLLSILFGGFTININLQ